MPENLHILRCTKYRLTHSVAFAGLEGLPECLALREVDVAERDRHLADRVVTAEAVVVEHLHVQRPVLQFLVRKSCNHTKHIH